MKSHVTAGNAKADSFSPLNLFPHKAFIGGEWIEAASKKTFPVLNPANQTILAHVPDMDAIDTLAAIDAAEKALPAWKNLTSKQRSVILYKWYHLILEQSEALSQLVTAEQGKPLTEARQEVIGGAEFVLWAAEESKRLYGDYIPAHKENTRILVTKEPIGIVAAITPWNFPSSMVTRKVPMALAAGCTVVLKPAEDTPLSALVLVALAEKAGLPAGVFNVVTASKKNAPVVGDVVLKDARVRKISFTGSTEVGKILMRGSADTVKKLSLELGGNAPFIIFESADLSEAVKGLMACKFRNGGQTCVCANRILVQDTIYDTFVDLFKIEVAAMRQGPGTQDGVHVGPLINDEGLQKVEGLVADAVAKGAKVATGGSRGLDTGPFYVPTILTNMAPTMRCFSEEIFGPVVPFYAFKTEEEAIKLANETPYGLASYIYSQDYAQVWRVGDLLQYGMVAVNEPLLTTELAPFGGVKESGIGREGSKYGIEEFIVMKYRLFGRA